MRFTEQSRWANQMNQVLGTAWTKVAEIANVRPAPRIGNWKSIDSGYDTEKYRHEINTGLRYAKAVLKDFPNSWKGFDDLKQIVDIEIWLRSKNGLEMNGAIAYTIAKNQAGRFLTKQIEEQTVAVENPDGSAVFDEFGKPVKIPRSLSFDHRELDEEGKPREISAAEETMIDSRPDARQEKKAWMEDIRRKMPLLERLVSSWFGAKRAIGEALLENPEGSVRDIPGVPKSTAARVRQAVLAEFRAIVDDSGTPVVIENTGLPG